MSKRIMIATEQSAEANQAANWLAESGLMIDSQVLVMHAVDKGAEGSGSSVGESVASLLQSTCPSATVETSLAFGSAGHCVLEQAAHWQSDLIVLGASKPSVLERMLLGSVGQHVTERAHCPVMIARHSKAVEKNNVLIAVDDSTYSGAALEWVSEQPWAKSKNIIILSVLNALPASFNRGGVSTAKAAEMLLRHNVEEALLSGLVATWSDMLAENLGRELVPFAVTEGDPIEMILTAAEQWSIEMIVIGANGRTSLSELLLGSVSQSIATKAGCTVAVVRGLTSTRFDAARTALAESSQLAKIKQEKPHPARITGGLSANNLGTGIGSVY